MQAWTFPIDDQRYSYDSACASKPIYNVIVKLYCEPSLTIQYSAYIKVRIPNSDNLDSLLARSRGL